MRAGSRGRCSRATSIAPNRTIERNSIAAVHTSAMALPCLMESLLHETGAREDGAVRKFTAHECNQRKLRIFRSPVHLEPIRAGFPVLELGHDIGWRRP